HRITKSGGRPDGNNLRRNRGGLRSLAECGKDGRAQNNPQGRENATAFHQFPPQVYTYVMDNVEARRMRLHTSLLTSSNCCAKLLRANELLKILSPKSCNKN